MIAMARTRLYCYIGLLKSEVLFLRHELTKRKSDDFLPKIMYIHSPSPTWMMQIKFTTKKMWKIILFYPTDCQNAEDHLKPSLRQNPGHFILHVGTNDLKFKRSYKAITKNIISIAVSLKSEVHNASASNIIVNKTIDN